jgi:tetratricopeptide (TPR) repeat protein
VLVACWALLAWSVPRLASAQPAAAEALFRAGREAVERGDHQTACDRFRESYRLETAVGTLINIAMCEEQLGELSRAWAHYQEAVHALPADDRRRETIIARLAAIDARLPRVTIALAPSAPPDTRVVIGSIELTRASFDVALPYDPGQYTLEAAAPGHASRTHTLALVEGQRAQLVVAPGEALAPVEAAAAPAPVPPAASTSAPAPFVRADAHAAASSAQRDIGWVLIGAASASAIATGIAGAFVIDRAAIVDDHCPRDMCDLEGERAAASGRSVYALFIAAGVSTLITSSVGIYLLLDTDSSSDSATLQLNGRF